MKKKPYKYLKFYHECIESGNIPYAETEYSAGGLCSIFPRDRFLKVLQPDSSDLVEQWTYWGADGGEYLIEISNWDTAFTPMRQNIVLLMAAMNGEL